MDRVLKVPTSVRKCWGIGGNSAHLCPELHCNVTCIFRYQLSTVHAILYKSFFYDKSKRKHRDNHRIKDDRMENSIKEIQIWHCTFAASIILCSTPT